MNEIPYETGSYYIFDRAYNYFKSIFKIETIGSYFVVRAKSNLQFKAKIWKRRLSRNVLSDTIGELTVYKSSKDYPLPIRKVCYWDKEQKRKFTFLNNAMELTLRCKLPNFIKTDGRLSCFFNGSSNILRLKSFGEIRKIQ